MNIRRLPPTFHYIVTARTRYRVSEGFDLIDGRWIKIERSGILWFWKHVKTLTEENHDLSCYPSPIRLVDAHNAVKQYERTIGP